VSSLVILVGLFSFSFPNQMFAASQQAVSSAFVQNSAFSLLKFFLNEKMCWWRHYWKLL